MVVNALAMLARLRTPQVRAPRQHQGWLPMDDQRGKHRHQSMASWWPRTGTSSVSLSDHFGVLVQVKLVGETLLDTLA